MNRAWTWNEDEIQQVGRELFKAGKELCLAGLGAAARLDDESQKVFDRLVERGRPVEEKGRKAVETAANRTQAVLREAKTLVLDTVEYESKAALKRLGLMTRDDVKILSARLDTLSRKIDEFAAQRP